MVGMIHLDTNYLIGLPVKGSAVALDVGGWLAAGRIFRGQRHRLDGISERPGHDTGGQPGGGGFRIPDYPLRTGGSCAGSRVVQQDRTAARFAV